MSDVAQGPDWWMSPDEQWHAPITPEAVAKEKRHVLVGAAVLVAALIAIGGIGIVVASHRSTVQVDATQACEHYMRDGLPDGATVEFSSNPEITHVGSVSTVRGIANVTSAGSTVSVQYTCQASLSGSTWTLVSLTAH